MKSKSALFLRELLEPNFQYYSAMIVPLDLDMCDVEAELPTTGFINGNSQRWANWEFLREVGGFSLTEEESLQLGRNGSVYKIECESVNVATPCFLLPEIGDKASKRRVVVSLLFDTSFDTAGIQSELWLSLYLEIQLGGFVTVDRELIARSKARRFQPGDSLTIECSGGTRRTGILILEERLGELRWRSTLYLVDGDSSDIVGASLVSIHQSSVDGHWATFRRVIGTVEEVKECSTLI